MQTRKAWITGTGGLIGSEIVRSARRWAEQWRVTGLTRAELELTDHDAVTSRFRSDSPDLIIHCAAMSRAADCAGDPISARANNVDATRHLAGLARNSAFIFLSTDLVLDGRKGNYTEEDSVNPLHVYGETKAEAERIVLENPRHTVLRIALNFGKSPTGDRGFNEQMHAALAAGQMLNLFTDEYRCPIATEVTARAIWELAGKEIGGLFLVGGGERVSRWDIGQALVRRWGPLPGTIQRASSKDYSGPPRPADLSLNCQKLQSLLSFPLPGFHEWLEQNPTAKV